MNLSIELKIADILSVANSQLVYCKAISGYPKKFDKNYNPSSVIDNFWMNTCKTFFYDSLLLTATLINKDTRTISFFNWNNFIKDNKLWLNQQADDFKNFGLKVVRDQVVGHVDVSNHNNKLPRHRRQGIINEILVSNLDKIQQALIGKFDEFTRSNGNPYEYVSFFSGDNAKKEVESALNIAKPELTSNDVVC